MKENVVYILKCRDKTLYTGWTNNLSQRVKDHNIGKGAKYTRGRGPVTLLYSEKCATKSTALKREWEIKRLTRAEKLNLITEGELK